MPKTARASVATLGLAAVCAAAGCGSPSAANIELRKQNQDLQAKLGEAAAQQKRDADALQAALAARPTVPTLPPDRLARLVTVHGLQFDRLTGGDNPDTVSGPDTMLKVYVVPIDGQGTAIKAAGSFTVEAFDLDVPTHPLVGTWRFPLEQSRDLFVDRFALYTYVLPCPWQTVPAHPNLTVKVTFDDELTGGTFVAQTQVSVHPPSATRPS